MIIKKEVPIKNRRMLKAAISATQKKRDDQLELLNHNSDVIQSKWTVERIVRSTVSETVPSLISGTFIYFTSLFGNGKPNEEGEQGSRSEWKSLIVEFIKSFGERYLERKLEPNAN